MGKLRTHSVPSIRTRRQREHRWAETLAILVTLTVPLLMADSRAAAQSAPPGAAGGAPARPAPPVSPVKYLEAGAKLFNKQKYPLAAKYLKAANDYRDQLGANEQQVLDAYLEEMGKVPAELMAAASAARAATAPAAASQPPVTALPSSLPAATASQPVAQATVERADGGEARGPAGDEKQRARWMLQQAREMIRTGQYDDAAETIAKVRAMNVKWGLFDETPAKLADVLAKARPKAQAAVIVHKDRKTAKSKLQQARALLADGNYDQAEAIALDVKTWKVAYGFFDDTPNKVAAAARALRSRDTQRRWGPREQPSQGVYDLLVRESRNLLAEGKFDQAKQKAIRAQRMRVVPPLSADRAEDVLQDISLAVAKAGQEGGGAMLAKGAEPASIVSEREANELLARGDTQAAAAKLAEADKLRLQEQGQGQGQALVPLQGPSDPAVQRVEAVSTLQPLPANGTGPAPAQAAPAPAPSRGDQLLSEAQALCASGNYPAAKQLATQAKTGGFGVDAKADEMLAQVALAEQGGALSVYEGALDAIRKNDLPRARSLLNELANSGGALDDGLSQKVQDLLAKLPQEGAGKAVASDLRNAQDAETLAAQKLNAEVGTRIAEARRLHEVDPDKAIQIYEQTIKTVKAAGVPEPLARPMVRRLEVGIELAKKDKVAYDIKMKDKTARAEIEQKRLRIFEADKAQKDRMKELMEKAMTAMAEGKYEEAEATAKLAQEVDPNDVTPGILAFKAKMERRLKRNQQTRDETEEAGNRSFQLVDEAAIADPKVQIDGIKYPTNFKELTERRLRMNEKLRQRKSPRTLAIEGKLNDSVTLNMDSQPLGEAIGFLANYTGLNIVLDPKALQEEGLTTASPVSLVASNIRLKTALKLLLKPMGLTYHIEDEVLLITSPQISQDQMQTQTYYVGDLIIPPGGNPSGNAAVPGAPMMDPTKPINPGDLQAQAAAMAGGFNGAPANRFSGASATPGERPRVDLSPIIQLITTSIAPGTWKVYNPETKTDESGAYGMGGGFGGGGGADAADNQPIGSITPFFLSISLIIRHTAEIHEQVADLLRQLRRLQDLQVSIEVRFITLSDSFFEAIGVDFDFTIESKALGKHATIAETNPAATLYTGPSAISTTSTTGGSGGGFAGGTGAGNLGGGSGALGGTGGSSLGGGLGSSGGSLGSSSGSGTTSSSTTAAPAPIIVNNIRDNTTPSSGPIIVGTGSGGIGNFTPDLTIPFTQGSASPALGGINNNTPGAGATFGIAFLSDLEVFLFLQAAQGDTRNNILQAPKVTTFNGAMASIINTQEITYVASLTPIVGFGSVAFMPQPSQFPNGVTLSVTPVVSADRRYVRMTLSPMFTALNSFDTLSVPAAVGGGGLGGGAAPINATIQLPNFSMTMVNTTVTVPDGGTVLLGGVKRLNEQRLEFGVPVLSKVPMINRLFRNIGIGRVTTSLMLMVTPRIIILEEEEERLGIPTIAL